MVRYWSKIANLPHLHLALGAHIGGDPIGISQRSLATKN